MMQPGIFGHSDPVKEGCYRNIPKFGREDRLERITRLAL